jgi:DNA invertase Pin-like site-specific DNA recombinase
MSTKNEGQDVTLQTDELREYAARAGWQVVGEYVDSGSKDRRPELDKLMHAVRRRKLDCVLVWKPTFHLVQKIGQVTNIETDVNELYKQEERVRARTVLSTRLQCVSQPLIRTVH